RADDRHDDAHHDPQRVVEGQREDGAEDHDHEADDRPHQRGDCQRFVGRLLAPTPGAGTPRILATAGPSAARAAGLGFGTDRDRSGVVRLPRWLLGHGDETIPTRTCAEAARRNPATQVTRRLTYMATTSSRTSGAVTLPVTGDAAADELLVRDPFALL